MPKLRTAIVDDHPIVIEGLKALLSNEANLKIVGGFYSGEALLSYLDTHALDLILLDITLPDMNGIELCQKIKAVSLTTSILILSNHTERSIIMQAIQNGASGYLLKNSSIDELRYCIAEAVKGQICYSKEITEIISRPTRNELQGPPRLTRREKEILSLIAAGKTSQVIGQELFLSPLTVDTHRKNLIQKFGVKNVAELIMVAVQQQIL
ncbi:MULTISPECIES: response regulator [unclassified Mucilaginibacter]|uniref:response regulator n=1 Tax=unclassified Mucilaginibacter TaxID=2617802 RepID=UPI0009635C69|nr:MULTISPECIES: response regulator transcription factor [unclassified Mucilaginibacter]OJW12759.1 MAG: DNA-binding response regulator [Mucilaginibacter sp. 44-25]PLW90656.1 MAG: DNA-binding response regulator [Mucilaginibacter sp.]PMP65418.1 MAG: DNA-binding response regulator [Mucilaginibacter sp.]HEK20827.1 response regulator transcription factor [Bacteroidota bacterium]